jgi:DNA-binding MarR family transcriptional regulator
VAADTGLSLPQSFALQQLNPEGRPESMRALAQCLQVDPSAITGLVDRLEAKGLVERRPDPDDRRVKALVLTPRGKRVRAHLRRILDEPPASLSRVDERRLRVVREVLAAMAAAEATE